MKEKISRNSIFNLFLASFCLFVTYLFISTRYDFYYFINDDMVIKDIISGVFTGRPEGRSIQILYPFGELLSGLYLINKNIPWYGFVICMLQSLSVFAVCIRLLKLMGKSYIRKIIAVATLFSVTGMLFLPEFVINQYTVTSAMLAGTAIFLIYTSDSNRNFKEFYFENLIAVFFVILSFMIRTEMLLLLFPILCISGFTKWISEIAEKKKNFFSFSGLMKYLAVLGTMILGMLISLLLNFLAYESSDWKQFNELFESRTAVYDYQGIPSYDENKAFYEEIGLDRTKQILLENYNYSLSPHIDETVMQEIAEYSKLLNGKSVHFVQRIEESMIEYVRRFIGEDDYQFIKIVGILYLILGAFAFVDKNGLLLLKVIMLFSVRSGLWIFIIYGRRTPARITHSLFWAEILLLFAYLLFDVYLKKRDRKYEKIMLVFSIMLVVGYSIKCLPATVENLDLEYVRREEVNQRYLKLFDYFVQHPENFYYIDVYSSVAYTEKIFDQSINKISNYDLLGGWAAKSPLAHQKMKEFDVDIDHVDDAFLMNENLYFVSDENKDVDWLIAYYQQQGQVVKPVIEDVIVNGEDLKFVIYKIALKGDANG